VPVATASTRHELDPNRRDRVGTLPAALEPEKDVMKIYTRGGDEGETVLLGGVRVPKDDPRVSAYGEVDELSSALGLALALNRAHACLDHQRLRAVQEDLFVVGAHLAAVDPDRALEKGTIPPLDETRTGALETWIDEMDGELPPLDAFVLPGGGATGAQLHVARTVCRRAERAIVGLSATRPELRDVVLPYMNRLSDLLFTLARFANRHAGIDDATWLPQRRRTKDG